MKKSTLLGTTLIVSSALTLISYPPLLSAPSCVSLLAVGGQEGQTVVQKTVSAPSIPVGIASLKRDNWNTDFAVDNKFKYKQFIATLKPENDGAYSVRMYLKYSNGTADEVYNNKPNLSTDKSLIMSGTPRTNQQPYQVNIFVGDAESVAKSYEISVKACR